MARKRQRDDDGEGGGGGGGGERGGGDEPSAPQRPRRAEKTIGEQTSHIKNKQRRGAIYERLKHKAAVRARHCCARASAARAHTAACGRCTRVAWRAHDQTAWRMRRRLWLGAAFSVSHAALTAWLRRLRGTQVAKKKTRVKKQQEAARAYEAGLEPPPRAVPKARPARAVRAPIHCPAHALRAADHREHARGGRDDSAAGRRGGAC